MSPRKSLTPVSLDLAAILGDLEQYFNDVHTAWEHEDEPAIFSLWTVHAHLIRNYPFTKVCTVYPWVTSWQPDTGKTELAVALSYVTPGGIVVTPTVAAITRFLSDPGMGTLIIDEFQDLGNKSRGDKDFLNSALNNGHRPGVSFLMASPNGGNEIRSTFYPKAFFGLAEYTPHLTIRTRCIRFKLHPYTDREQVELEARQALRPTEPTGKAIRKTIESWLSEDIARQIDKAMLATETRTLNDGHTRLIKRESGNFRMLFAIADMAGGKYPALIRRVAERLSTGSVTPEADPTEAERLDNLLLGLARNGRLPIDNWLKPGISPLHNSLDTVLTYHDLGFTSDTSNRRKPAKDMLPMVTLTVNDKAHYAELRIKVRDLPLILTALENIDQGSFLAAYRAANRLTHLTKDGKPMPIQFHSGDRQGAKMVAIDFTTVVYGKDEANATT